MKLTPARLAQIKLQLINLEKQDTNSFFRDDPVLWIDRSLSVEDQEVLSFVLSGLSYGRVEQIKTDFFKLLQALEPFEVSETGKGIFKFITESESFVDLKKPLKTWKHRLNTPQDLIALFSALNSLYRNTESLVTFFDKAHSLEKSLVEFSKYFPEKAPSSKWSGTGASWWAPNPEGGGACKKILMWLRWLTRKTEPDLGIWSHKLDASRLLVPLDTHILNWAYENKISQNKNPTWKQVQNITSVFSKIFPEDPLRCDYLICHAGMTNFRNTMRN